MEKNVLTWRYILVTIAKLSIPSFFDANCHHDGVVNSPCFLRYPFRGKAAGTTVLSAQTEAQ
jgi:hypothetical protein